MLKSKDVEEDEQAQKEQQEQQAWEQEQQAQAERGRRKEVQEQARMVLATRTPLMAPSMAKKDTRRDQQCRPNRNVLVAPGEEENTENDENGRGSRNQRNRSTHRVPQLLWNTPVKHQQQLRPGKDNLLTETEASGTTSREETLVAILSTLQSKLKQQQCKINALEQRQQALRLYSR